MNPQQFCDALAAFHERASELPGTQGTRICEYIANAVALGAPAIDERLVQIHRQLTLVDLRHRLTRAECQTTMAMG